MNVAFDRWIPVVTITGTPEKVSLLDVLTEGEKYADLAVRPHERVALMRLFLCVAHAALNGPKNYDEWEVVPQKLPNAAQEYLEKWKDHFELFHPTRPWLQVAELRIIQKNSGSNSTEDKEWASLAKLSLTRSSGNTSTLFDHASMGDGEEVWEDYEIALALLAFQNFFVAGGKASSRFWGVHEMSNPPNPKGGPCSGKSILFTFLRMNNLADSIHYNLNSYEDLKFIYGDDEAWLGKPLWEIPITTPYDQNSIENATRKHLGRLVPMTRILLLHKNRTKVLLGAGFDYPKFQDENNPFYPDVFSTIVTGADGKRELLSYRPNRAIWRELHSLTVRQKSSSASSHGPLCLLNLPDMSPCDILVNAVVTNPQQAAELLDLVESVFHIPTKLFDVNGPIAFESEVRTAESLARKLGWAIEDYRKEIDGAWEGRLKVAGPKSGELKAKLHSTATSHYWTAVEKNLGLLMAHIEAIGTDKAISSQQDWQRMLLKSACYAYRVACGQETSRQIKAFAKGWQKLNSTKDEPESDNIATEEVNQ